MQIIPKARLLAIGQRVSNHYTTTNYFYCYISQQAAITTRWLPCYNNCIKVVILSIASLTETKNLSRLYNRGVSI